MENYRKRFIHNNRVKKISSEPDGVIKRATSGSQAWVAEPFSTWGGTSDRQKSIQNFCDSKWQL